MTRYPVRILPETKFFSPWNYQPRTAMNGAVIAHVTRAVSWEVRTMKDGDSRLAAFLNARAEELELQWGQLGPYDVVRPDVHAYVRAYVLHGTEHLVRLLIGET